MAALLDVGAIALPRRRWAAGDHRRKGFILLRYKVEQSSLIG